MSDRFIRQSAMVPRDVLTQQSIYVIGCGAIGRQLAVQLAAIGASNLTLIDFDTVDESNVTTQGYLKGEVGLAKVAALEQTIREIDDTIRVVPVNDRFRLAHIPAVKPVIFCCVDSISAREAIWGQVFDLVSFWADARMLGETIRVLTADDELSGQRYAKTLFAQSEAQSGSCTSRSTIYASGIAAGLMVHQFTRYLRKIPRDRDVLFNLLASELSVDETSLEAAAPAPAELVAAG